MYVHIILYCGYAHEEGAVCVDTIGIRILYIYSSGAVSSIRGKQMTPAVASERSIFSENHDYNTYIKSFSCRGEHVRTYISGYRCTRWQKLRTDTHTWDSHSDDNNKDYSKR